MNCICVPGIPYNNIAAKQRMVFSMLMRVKSSAGLKCDTLSDWGVVDRDRYRDNLLRAKP